MDKIKKRKKIILALFAIIIIMIFIACDLLVVARRNKIIAPAETVNTPSGTDQYKSSQEIDLEKDNPNDSSITSYNEGLKQFDQGKYDLALIDFSRAIEINPKKDEYYNKKSQTEMNLGKKQEALDTIKLGLVNNPNSDLLKTRLDILQTNLSNNQDGAK